MECCWTHHCDICATTDQACIVRIGYFDVMLMLYVTLCFSIYMHVNKYVNILKYEDATYEEDAAVWIGKFMCPQIKYTTWNTYLLTYSMEQSPS